MVDFGLCRLRFDQPALQGIEIAIVELPLTLTVRVASQRDPGKL